MSERYTAIGADGARRPLVLGEVLHKGGGAGRIVAVENDPLTVAKLYHHPRTAQPYEAKVTAMLERRPELPPIEEGGRRFVQLAWPQALIEDASGTFRGFTMPFVDLSEAAPLEALMVAALRRHHGLPENYLYRLFAAQNVAALVAELHRLGHHVIDLKPQNLSVYKRSMYVAVVDCDGLSIDGGGVRYPAYQFTDGYRAPEAVADRLNPDQLGNAQDRFALAVILFQLLNSGIHPFQGVPARRGDALGTEQERINQGLYAYGAKECPRQAPAPGSIHGFLEDETRALFDQAFTSRYRPSAREWRNHMRELIESGALRRCAREPETHAHFSKGCGLCEVEAGKQARLAAARARAGARAGARRRPAATRFRRPAYTIVLRRRPTVPRRLAGGVWKAVAAGLAARLAHGAAKLIFGGGRRMTSMRPTPPGCIAALYAVYGIFTLNIFLLGGIAASLFFRHEFQQLAQRLAELGVLRSTEELSNSELLLLMQGQAILAVGGCTVGAVALCYWLGRTMGTLARTHARWLKRTFWYMLALTFLAVVVGSLTWPVGIVALAMLPLWLLHRWAKGLGYLITGKPMAGAGALI